jgi:hypothetical protein
MRSFGSQPWLDTSSGRHGNSMTWEFDDSDVQKIQYGANDYSGMEPGLVGMPGPRDFQWFTNHSAAFQLNHARSPNCTLMQKQPLVSNKPCIPC